MRRPSKPGEVIAPPAKEEDYLSFRANTDLRSPYRIPADYLRGTHRDAAFEKLEAPLIAFVNARSGGRLGTHVANVLCKALGRSQVYDLGEYRPEKVLATLWDNLMQAEAKGDMRAAVVKQKLRILAAGGDGTVAWIMKAVRDLNLQPPPPIAILPLGTGNDLSRSLNWGPAFMDNWVDNDKHTYATMKKIADAPIKDMDCWVIRIHLPNERLLKGKPHSLKVIKKGCNTFRMPPTPRSLPPHAYRTPPSAGATISLPSSISTHNSISGDDEGPDGVASPTNRSHRASEAGSEAAAVAGTASPGGSLRKAEGSLASHVPSDSLHTTTEAAEGVTSPSPVPPLTRSENSTDGGELGSRNIDGLTPSVRIHPSTTDSRCVSTDTTEAGAARSDLAERGSVISIANSTDTGFSFPPPTGLPFSLLEDDEDQSQSGSSPLSSPVFLDGVFWNYFSVGLDAKAAYQFHHLREVAPNFTSGRLRNQFWYSFFSCTSGWFCAAPGVKNKVVLEVKKGKDGQEGDWEEVNIPGSVKALVVVNLQSYGGGRPIWGNSTSHKDQHKKGFVPPSFEDGLLEVCGFKSGWHAMAVMASAAKLAHAKRLAQASGVRLHLRSQKVHPAASPSRAFVQLDGEPWEQPIPSGADEGPIVVEILQGGKSRLLVNTQGMKADAPPLAAVVREYQERKSMEERGETAGATEMTQRTQ